MRLGAQMSTAGGLHLAFQRGREAGCDSIMIFTKSNRQWYAKPLTEQDIADYKAAVAEYSDIYPVCVHASYLINCCSPDAALWDKSAQALKEELDRAEALGTDSLTFHPGAFMESDEDTGLQTIARALRRVLADTAGYQTKLCIESMAGTGSTMGFRFEHLAYLLEHGIPSQGSGYEDRLGVCLDTCHLFAAGYDFRAPEGYARAMADFDRLVGLNRVHCFHLNDSKYELGARKDRHDHIGRGYIGLEGFAHFVNDPRWTHRPAHLETPKSETGEDGNEIEMDPVNLATLRSLIQ